VRECLYQLMVLEEDWTGRARSARVLIVRHRGSAVGGQYLPGFHSLFLAFWRQLIRREKRPHNRGLWRFRIGFGGRFALRVERIGDAFPGPIPITNGVLDKLVAPLEVAVAHRRVQVERRIFDVIV
jgi:hypothetical protein